MLGQDGETPFLYAPAVVLTMTNSCANMTNSNSFSKLSNSFAKAKKKLSASTTNCTAKGQILLHKFGHSPQP